MTVPIKAKRLRATLPDVVERVRDGRDEPMPLADDPLYRAIAVGVSSDGRCSTDHDLVLYSR